MLTCTSRQLARQHWGKRVVWPHRGNKHWGKIHFDKDSSLACGKTGECSVPSCKPGAGRCQGGERITPALTFTTALAFRQKRNDVYASLLFWGSRRTVPPPAQLSFDLAFVVAPVTLPVPAHCAPRRPSPGFAAASVPPRLRAS